MKVKIQEFLDETMELQIAPLIDCVFQLLIYFMVSASLHKTEADLGISLPGSVLQATNVQMPDEQIIEIQNNGAILINGKKFDTETSRELPELVGMLNRYRDATRLTKTKALVTITAAEDVPHQRVVDVMNACAAAKIKDISFGLGGSQ